MAPGNFKTGTTETVLEKDREDISLVNGAILPETSPDSKRVRLGMAVDFGALVLLPLASSRNPFVELAQPGVSPRG